MPPIVSQVIPEVAVLSSKSTPETTEEFNTLLANEVNLAKSETESTERNEIASREPKTYDESNEIDTQNEMLAMAASAAPPPWVATASQEQAAGEVALAAASTTTPTPAPLATTVSQEQASGEVAMAAATALTPPAPMAATAAPVQASDEVAMAAATTLTEAAPLAATVAPVQASGEVAMAAPEMDEARAPEIIAALHPQAVDGKSLGETQDGDAHPAVPNMLPKSTGEDGLQVLTEAKGYDSKSAVDKLVSENSSQEGRAEAPSALPPTDRKVSLELESAATTRSTPATTLSFQSQARGGDSQQPQEAPHRPAVETPKPPEQQAPDGVSVVNASIGELNSNLPQIEETSAGGNNLPGPLRPLLATVRYLAQNGNSTIRLQLQPEHLGRVYVQLTRGADGLRILLTADTPTTIGLLQSYLTELENGLASAGIDVGKLSVTVEQGQAQTEQGQEPRSPDQDRPEAQSKRDETDEAPLGPRVPTSKNALVDLRI